MHDFLDKCTESLRTVGKLLLHPGKSELPRGTGRIYILGNGPSLKDSIARHEALLKKGPCMCVNFAPDTPEFYILRPKYHIAIDPVFYKNICGCEGAENENVRRMYENIRASWSSTAGLPGWELVTIVPASVRAEVDKALGAPAGRVAGVKAIGMEGFGWLQRWIWDTQRGMPRPRNVLIAAIMVGVWMGYDEIILLGADHSWLADLAVTDQNKVVPNQSHYYQATEEEKVRVEKAYEGVRLHQVLESMAVAMRSYHLIRRWAGRRGVRILNATPGSMIDAFPRITL